MMTKYLGEEHIMYLLKDSPTPLADIIMFQVGWQDDFREKRSHYRTSPVTEVLLNFRVYGELFKELQAINRLQLNSQKCIVINNVRVIPFFSRRGSVAVQPGSEFFMIQDMYGNWYGL